MIITAIAIYLVSAVCAWVCMRAYRKDVGENAKFKDVAATLCPAINTIVVLALVWFEITDMNFNWFFCIKKKG